MSKGKYVWGAVILVVLLVVIGALLKSDKYAGPTASPSPNGNNETMPLSPSPSASSRKPATQAPTISYDAALKTYGGNRIQFDEFCQATPNAIIVKSGASVMFDNRSGDARWFSLDGTGYYVAGYGFRIIPMAPKSIPHTTTIGCGSATSVGKITIVQ